MTPDWTALGSGIGAAIGAVLVKVGWDAKRGGGLKEKLDTHMKDDDGKFDKLTAAVQRAADVAVETKLETLRVASKIAEDVAFIRGQLSKD